jgi:large repetitive protein
MENTSTLRNRLMRLGRALIILIMVASQIDAGTASTGLEPNQEVEGISVVSSNVVSEKEDSRVSQIALAPDCINPPNEIVAENCLPGNPPSEWDVNGAGDASIQGFATDISVDQGGTIDFKVDTDATDYRLDIYRLGYYNSDGARFITTIQPSATLPQTQPACFFDGTNDINLIDCGNWAVAASWNVPANATSGVYIAKLVREDGPAGASHITFIVRNDDGNSDLLFQTSDTTWQAYNQYGGYSLYGGAGVLDGGHAHKVSYNRPFTTRDTPTEDWLFNAEYPMLRWLERSGYDVSYFTDVDSDRYGSEILEHKVFLSVGHDEYWSAGQRTAVEVARDTGVHLAFFSGNEIYWKTRWEPSTADGGNTPYRTLVSYKEGDAQGGEHYNCQGNFDCDPDPSVWTGLWRQNQTGHDGGRPENALSGQISWGDATTAIQVPASATALRFWRNTGMTGNTTLNAGTLGYEFDWEQPAYASSYPAGRITLSDTTAAGKNHKMSLYRASSGALVFGAGTVQWSWGLDETHDRAASIEDSRVQQATVNLLSDMGVQPGSLQDGLVPGGALDTAAPTATITDPAPGATVPGGNVTVSGTAADTGGIVAAVEVSTDGGTTWARATGTTNWTYTFSASDGPVTVQARAIDDAANIGAASSVSFEVGPQECPCSIWTPQVGGGTTFTDGPVELGVKFRAGVDGYITGIRFWKPSGATGTHVGHLWTTAGGSPLGEVTFSGETVSGWQEATFASPIAVVANTTYIASYHAPSGYSSSNGYFAASGVDSPPLHALANGVDGPNGVYKYGASGSFPNETFQSSNYWVDVVFVTEVGPDTTPPTVSSVTPANNASNVSRSANVSAVFSEPLDAATVDGTTFELRDSASQLVSAAVTYNNATRTATLDPNTAPAYSSTYTAKVIGGASGVKDPAGNALAADYEWSFTTAAAPPPPPDEGPGGPILVVASASNPFGRYFAEILRAEGFNEFTVTDVSNINATLLGNYDVLILGEVSLGAAQVTLLTDWVNAGGNLIASRPDSQLAGLLGLTSEGSTLSEGYLLVNTASAPGAGIVNQTIQFHGAADRYSLNGATSVATLYSNATSATSNPAVTLISVGSNGGQAAAFTYDLARSIVYTRQGNPAWQGINGDGSSGPVRADDMFHNGTDPDWVNLNKVAIPQADEQQRLLANLILTMNQDNNPLPRFWYLPRGEKAAVVMTMDEHGGGELVTRLNRYNELSLSGCSLEDWECVRSTAYIYTNAPITDTQLAAFQAQGHEFAVHVNTGCANFTPSSLANDYATQIPALAAQFPSINAQRTQRTHCIAFSDWSSQPKVQLQNEMRFDTNYYYWPASWIQDRPGMFTGSGMPMRFADLDGTMIDVYQATTQMTDESGQTIATHINTLLNNAVGAPGYYGVFTANMHTDGGANASNGAEFIIASAQSHSVPVVSAQQMLDWLDGRNASSFDNITWSGNALSFDVNAHANARGLQAILPSQNGSFTLESLTRNGASVFFTVETIKGISYARFAASSGAHVAQYSSDTTAPTVTAVTPAASATDVVLNTNVTAQFSEPMDPLTLQGGGFELRDAADAVIAATVNYDTGTQVATLTPNAALAPNTQYTAKLKGGTGGVSDIAGNPLAADFTWSFTTADDSCPCSIWDNTSNVGAQAADSESYELGVKFRSSQDGFITALRFYKHPQNTGTHMGRLWNMSGNLLGSATFTNETASGWQEVILDPPVAITANTVYAASYSTNTGNYAFSANYFTSQGVDNGPLHALSAAESPAPGTNGFFNETPGVFPNASFNDANYWVDVVFDTTIPGDTTPPVISNVTATPAGDGTAEITWDTDEASDSLVQYGTTSGALNLSEATPLM